MRHLLGGARVADGPAKSEPPISSATEQAQLNLKSVAPGLGALLKGGRDQEPLTLDPPRDLSLKPGVESHAADTMPAPMAHADDRSGAVNLTAQQVRWAQRSLWTADLLLVGLAIVWSERRTAMHALDYVLCLALVGLGASLAMMAVWLGDKAKQS